MLKARPSWVKLKRHEWRRLWGFTVWGLSNKTNKQTNKLAKICDGAESSTQAAGLLAIDANLYIPWHVSSLRNPGAQACLLHLFSSVCPAYTLKVDLPRDGKNKMGQ